MGWTAGYLKRPFTSHAAIAFDLGDDFAARIVRAELSESTVYAAVRSQNGGEVFALVLLVRWDGDRICTKPMSEDMGPVEDRCPLAVLRLLTAPNSQQAHEWRRRCQAYHLRCAS